MQTQSQIQAVAQIRNRPDFKRLCSEEGVAGQREETNGPVTVLWYDVEAELHLTRIARSGKVLREVVTEKEGS